jgi:Na+-transporting methylmalonyl-CoA/oxaloacetate decarboxylase gamma subunit
MWWNQVSETVTYGLQITVIGMLLVFFTLALIILSVVLLAKLPALQARKAQEPQETRAEALPKLVTEQQIATDTVTAPTADDELAQVAAIAVVMLRSRQRVGTRPQARTVGSAWKHYGRAHQHGL